MCPLSVEHLYLTTQGEFSSTYYSSFCINFIQLNFSVGWYKEDHNQKTILDPPLTKPIKTLLSHISILSFPNVSQSNKGTYKCLAFSKDTQDPRKRE